MKVTLNVILPEGNGSEYEDESFPALPRVGDEITINDYDCDLDGKVTKVS